MKKQILLMCALLISVITLSGAVNRSFHTTLEQWNPIGFTQAQSGPQITNRLTAGSAILPTVATAAPSGVLRGGSANVITFTTAKKSGEKISLYMLYEGAAPTLSGATGTPESGKRITYKLTSQTVTIRGDVTELDCSRSQLTALDVSMDTKLTYLNCWSNQLTALDVPKNTALTKLDCKNNQLTTLNVSNDTALRSLYCHNNQLKALDVSKNTKLIILTCFGNQIKGEEMTRLVNSLPDRPGTYAGLFAVVQEPDLEGNICLKSDVAIAKGKNWNTQKYKSDTKKYFDYEGEEASPKISFTTTKAVGETVELMMGYSGAAPTLSGATGTPKIGRRITYKLTSQTVTITGDVTFLDCIGNQLTTLDVSKNTALKSLHCSNNQLTALDLSQNFALKGLSCNNNQLTALDVSKNTALTELSCYNNQLKALDVSRNTALTELDCSGNQIKGEEMKRLVNSLPDHNNGKVSGRLTVVREPDLEGNICLRSDVAIAKGKRWYTKKYKSDTKEYVAYEGNPYTISFTTSKKIGETVKLWMEYSGDTPTLSGATGTPELRKRVIYKLTSQTVTITGDVIDFDCCENQITSLDVSNNTGLTGLSCYNNPLTALDVSKNTALEWLSCNNNQLTALDVSQTRLRGLDCFNNQIKGAEMTRLVNSLPDRTGNLSGSFVVVQEPALEGNICLDSDVAIAKGKNWNTKKRNSDTGWKDDYEGEEASTNVITFTTAKKNGESVVLKMTYTGDAPTLSGLTGTPESGKYVTYKLTSQTVTIRGDVTYFDCSKNQLTTLDVSKNTALTELYCSENQLTALDVSKNTALTRLICFYNQLTALDLPQNTALTALYCDNNQLTTLDVSKNTKLTYLSCESNPLTALDVSQNAALTKLVCEENQLTALDVSKNTALTELYSSDNQLTALDVSKNKALTELKCSNNQLTALDVSKNTALTVLNCSNNQLTALDLSQNTALTELYCSDNQLTALDVSKNTALTWLYCNNNQLTTLDVSKNTALKWFYCNNNQLTALDVSQNIALEDLNCSHNQLTALDVPKNTALTGPYCCNNQLTTRNVSENTGLTKLDCSGNQIKGEEMTRLVNGLPDRMGMKAGEIVVVQSDAESNRCLKSDVAIAKSKNWNTLKYKSDIEDYVDYEGEEPIPYAVTLTKEGEGTLTATGADDLTAVLYGTELTIEATPAAGYELKALTANGTDILATKKFTVTADTEVKATFAKKTAADVVESSSVRLYPNPASTYVNVKGAKADALVRLYDANGSLRYEARTDADGTLQIDLSAYAEGTYLLRVGDDAQRLLIQR